MVSSGVWLEQWRRRRYPDTGTGEWPVGVWDVGVTGRTVRLDRTSDLFTQRDAFALRGTFGDGLERCHVRLIDHGFLVRIKLGEDVPRRRARRARHGGHTLTETPLFLPVVVPLGGPDMVVVAGG